MWLRLEFSWLGRHVNIHSFSDFLQQEIGSSHVARVSLTRWRAVRAGSELSRPVFTSLPTTKPLPDLLIPCELKTKYDLLKSWRIRLPRVSEKCGHNRFVWFLYLYKWTLSGVSCIEFIVIPPCWLFEWDRHGQEDWWWWLTVWGTFLFFFFFEVVVAAVENCWMLLYVYSSLLTSSMELTALFKQHHTPPWDSAMWHQVHCWGITSEQMQHKYGRSHYID